ncbi:calpain-B isoform X2 [Nematostella vectensis]|uniref:calpain-B isoform X2 n=1 Tax=Nematostella vectensis TaxID=45351 RepID=UPI00207770D2|nr:calpain-B isoform X2 [Nematostella vectensis]
MKRYSFAGSGTSSFQSSSTGSFQSSSKSTFQSSSFTRTRSRSHSSSSNLWSSSLSSTSNYFEDPEFPAKDESVFHSKKPPKPFEWKRPWEICSEPRFYVDGASRLDIKQGVLGNCWLLAAMSVLAQHKPLVDRIMPEGVYEADRFSPRYTGKVVFKLWQYGEWVTVIIDDRLPTYKGKLVFVHSPEKNEFWCALLEKAYAKIHGSYEALKGGLTGEALEDFTGGLSEVFVLEDAPANLFQIMQRAEKRSALMGCSINAFAGEIETDAGMGLYKGHAYSITAVRKVFLSTRGGVELIRIRNPWGDEKEWTGAWGDRSPEWQELSQDEKRSLDLEFDVDGEFWMSFEDFKSHFDKLEVCMLDVENAIDKTQISFNSRLENGSWRKHVSAGGCRNFLETFHTNPQFRITLHDGNEDEDNLSTVVIALMQKDRRRSTLANPIGSNHTIGFALYKIDVITKRKYGVSRLDKEYFQFNKSTERSTFINSREVVGRFELAPGEYVIVPSTFIQNAEADFLLRIFSEKAVSSSALTESTFFGSLGIDQVDLKDMNDAEKFRVFFDKFAGEAEEIDAVALQRILSIAFSRGLLSTCLMRTTVACWDTRSFC